MSERDHFMLGSCTAEQTRESFDLLDTGQRRDTATMLLAQQVCKTTCTLYDSCRQQVGSIAAELQKSGAEGTSVIAGERVELLPLSEEVRTSLEMFRPPDVTWPQGELPEDPASALSLIRLARRAGRIEFHAVSHKRITPCLTRILDEMQTTLQDNGLFNYEATTVLRSIVKMYTICMDTDPDCFTAEEHSRLVAIAAIFTTDVRRLREMDFKSPVELACVQSADYYEKLWEYCSERWSITPISFRSVMRMNMQDPIGALNKYIAAHPDAQEPPEVRLRLDGSNQTKATPEEVEAARIALQIYEGHEHFPPSFLERLASRGPAALEDAQSYLRQLEATLKSTQEQDVDVPVSRIRAAIFNSKEPVSEQALLKDFTKVDLKQIYLNDLYIKDWVAARAVELYPGEEHLMLERLRYLMHWGFIGFVKAAKDLEADAHPWQCRAPRGRQGTLIPTLKFLELKPGERASLIHALNLGPLLGKQPLALETISQQYGIDDPATLAQLITPSIDRPDANDTEAPNMWKKFRHRVFRGDRVVQDGILLNEKYLQTLRDYVIPKTTAAKQEYHYIDTKALLDKVRLATGFITVEPRQETIPDYSKLIRHVLGEAEKLSTLNIPYEERFAFALCYGAEYTLKLAVHGPEHLVEHMRNQAYALLGLTPESLKRLVNPERTAPAKLPPPVAEQPTVTEQYEAEPGQPETTPASTKAGQAKAEPANPEEQHDQPAQQPKLAHSKPEGELVATPPDLPPKVHNLPLLERAAVYVVMGMRPYLTPEMKELGLHKISELIEYFELKSYSELVDLVQHKILPKCN